ncbi:MAG: APC family permease [Actinomycetota bacterium]
MSSVKRLLVGRAISSDKAEHQLLPKSLALPVFSSDPLSSVSYATEEMMLVLVLAGAGALTLMLPIGFAIALLLAIVVSSYRQTVRAYPRGGGSYIVSKENLGTIPGLIAAAAILIDYILTVAVSVTAGTIAVASAVPAVDEHRVLLAFGFVTLIALLNLRGTKEAGVLFAVPTYGFVVLVAVTLGTGLIQCLSECRTASSASLPLQELSGITLFLILRAFSSGATALTGVEAIADGVQAFRRPQSRNAASTLAIMAAISISMFLGITFLARELQVRVTEHSATSVLAQVGETVFGGGGLFLALQAFTAGILFLAANTAFQDFPRLSAILARDRFMPSQFRNRGDRLVFSNGVIVLTALAMGLVWAFSANLTRLIQLYVVGVFTAFTLSQTGMVRRWLRLKKPGWRRSALINGIGAVTTGVVLVIVTLTKFTRGAWIVIAAMPVIVGFFLFVRNHYARVGRLLRGGHVHASDTVENTFVLLVSDLGPETTYAIGYLRALRPKRIVAVFSGDPADYEDTAVRWTEIAPRFGKLELLAGGEEHRVRSLRVFLRSIHRDDDDFVTVVLPERLGTPSVWRFVQQRRALWLKARLLFERGVVVTDVPLLPDDVAEARVHADRPLEPRRSVVLVPISAVHDATLRAVIYAKGLHSTELQALYFAAGDPEEIPGIIEAWTDARVDVPLAIVDASFRDLGPPLLEEVRRQAAPGDTVVTVVLPEFVVDRWWEHLLHNQTGLYIKRLLLFERHVVVTSVPFHLKAAAERARTRDQPVETPGTS